MKKLALFVLIGIVTSPMFGCGGSSSPTAATTPVTPPAQAVVGIKTPANISVVTAN